MSIFLSLTGLSHKDNDNMDYYYQLEIWKGNINGVLRQAREREELSDWLVAMAPMGKSSSRFLFQQNTNVLVKQVLGYKVPKNDNFFFFI